ncbi:MAG TPA: hypothetical protein VFX70_17465 [Mycobacteriales bacterium]|nr:hypothetical protein [Mycobacteriales bacterium]
MAEPEPTTALEVLAAARLASCSTDLFAATQALAALAGAGFVVLGPADARDLYTVARNLGEARAIDPQSNQWDSYHTSTVEMRRYVRQRVYTRRVWMHYGPVSHCGPAEPYCHTGCPTRFDHEDREATGDGGWTCRTCGMSGGPDA